jgi:hypothetical protein
MLSRPRWRWITVCGTPAWIRQLDIGMPQVMGPVLLVRPLCLAGSQTLVRKFCARTGSMGAPRQTLPE